MYLNPDKITDLLPGAFPQLYKTKHPGANDEALTLIWQNKVEATIAHYSRYIDEAIGDRYPKRGAYKFAVWDVGSGTPSVIGEICYYLSYSALQEYFNPAKKGGEDKDEETYYDRAQKMLKQIRSGEIVIYPDEETVSSGLRSVTRSNVMTADNFESFGR